MAHNNGNKATLTSNLDKCENQNESGREDEESEFQTTPLHNIYIYILFFSRKKEWFQLLGICFYFILGSNNSWNALLPKYILQVQKTFSQKLSQSQRISTEKKKTATKSATTRPSCYFHRQFEKQGQKQGDDQKRPRLGGTFGGFTGGFNPNDLEDGLPRLDGPMVIVGKSPKIWGCGRFLHGL